MFEPRVARSKRVQSPKRGCCAELAASLHHGAFVGALLPHASEVICTSLWTMARFKWGAPSYFASSATVRITLLQDAFKQVQHFDLPECMPRQRNLRMVSREDTRVCSYGRELARDICDCGIP